MGNSDFLLLGGAAAVLLLRNTPEFTSVPGRTKHPLGPADHGSAQQNERDPIVHTTCL